MKKITKIAVLAVYPILCYFAINCVHSVVSAQAEKYKEYRNALMVYFDEGGKHNAGKDYNGGNGRLEASEAWNLLKAVGRKYDINEITNLSVKNEFPIAFQSDLEKALADYREKSDKLTRKTFFLIPSKEEFEKAFNAYWDKII